MPCLIDAHNHLQDERFGNRHDTLLSECRAVGVRCMVVNGTCEEDWGAVRTLAQTRNPMVLPSFGIHPWRVHARSPGWEARLAALLDQIPSGVGEIGLDRWKPRLSYEGQEEVFRRQLQMAAERNVPASIHCLRAWGRMLELLRQGPRPACGFLLHSYGGSRDLVPPLADLGAFFSLSGSCVHERNLRQREALQAIPMDRLLLETDAPDQLLPSSLEGHRLLDREATRPINHPANLAVVYAFAARLLGVSPEQLEQQLERNFVALFGGLHPPGAAPGGTPEGMARGFHPSHRNDRK